MQRKIPIDWSSLIYRAVESDELDYKAAQNWRDLNRQGKAKFVRHCLAMANTKGGYIIVGVGEDESGKPSVYTGMTDRQAKSFDPTDVGHFINRYADPAIDFDIEKPVVDGKTYVVFVVRRFATLPHVCGYGCECELQQGAFYIRTADASSRVAYRASEIHGIIQRALRNQRESLGRMLRGILYEQQYGEMADAKSLYADEIALSRNFAAGRGNTFDIRQSHLLEFSAEISSFNAERFQLSDIRYAVTKSVCDFTGVPFLFTGNLDDSYCTNTSLRYYSKECEQFWQAFRSGLFHYISPVDCANGISYKNIIRFVAEAVYFISEYYAELGLEEEIVILRFRLHNVENVELRGLENFIRTKKALSGYSCKINKVKVRMERSVADLTAGVIEHAARVVQEICERFNLSSDTQEYLEETISMFLGKKI